MAVIFGVLGLKSQIRGLAITGIICGTIGIILMVTSVIVGIAMNAGNF